MAERYFEIMDELSERLGVPLLTHQYQIACVLLDLGQLTPKELFSYSRLSSTGFFKTLDEMIARGAIYHQVNSQDRRSKLYCLHEDVKAAILDQFKFYRASSLQAFRSLGIENPEASIQSRHKIHKLKVKHVTCELQILLYLFLRPGISYTQFLETVGVSETKFSATLRQLSGRGLIFFERDPCDRRRKLYYITDEVREVLAELQDRSHKWLVAVLLAQPAGESEA